MVSLQQFNFYLQILIFIMLSVGFFVLKKQRNLRAFTIHGRVMLGAVVLNFISFLLVMGPAMLGLRPFMTERPLHLLTISTILHASFGTLAEVIGGYLAFSWVLHSSIKSCAGKKTVMRVTFIVWSIALVSGVIEYTILYVF